jgi:L-lactate dehydrogenase complex protein LldE
LHIQSQPRDLLNSCEGIHLAEMNKPDTCCGFGGTFCIKYPDISDRLVERKAEDIVATGATRVVAGDVGCILNMEGKLHRQGASVSVSHVAEILAGMVED